MKSSIVAQRGLVNPSWEQNMSMNLEIQRVMFQTMFAGVGECELVVWSGGFPIRTWGCAKRGGVRSAGDLCREDI